MTRVPIGADNRLAGQAGLARHEGHRGRAANREVRVHKRRPRSC
jgi:hypothetical protein